MGDECDHDWETVRKLLGYYFRCRKCGERTEFYEYGGGPPVPNGWTKEIVVPPREEEDE